MPMLVNKQKVRTSLIKRMEGKTFAHFTTTTIIIPKGISPRDNGQLRLLITIHNVIDGPVGVHGHQVLVRNSRGAEKTLF